MNARWLWLWAALWWAPGVAEGHGLEFLLAKVTPGGDGIVRMQISADFTANPLIPDAATAEKVIADVLMLQDEGAARPCGKSSGIRFETTRDIDPTCPFQIPPAPGGARHELLTGYLEEPAAGSELELSIPRGNPHDVILWTIGEGDRGAATEKYYLIAGDSVRIPLPPRRRFPWMVVALGLGVLLVSGMLVWRLRPRGFAATPCQQRVTK